MAKRKIIKTKTRKYEKMCGHVETRRKRKTRCSGCGYFWCICGL